MKCNSLLNIFYIVIVTRELNPEAIPVASKHLTENETCCGGGLIKKKKIISNIGLKQRYSKLFLKFKYLFN